MGVDRGKPTVVRQTKPKRRASAPVVTPTVAAHGHDGPGTQAPTHRTVTVRAHTRQVPIRLSPVRQAPSGHPHGNTQVTPLQALADPAAVSEAQRRHARETVRVIEPVRAERAKEAAARVTASINREEQHRRAGARKWSQPIVAHDGSVAFHESARQAAFDKAMALTKLGKGDLQRDPIAVAHQIGNLSDESVKKWLKWQPSQLEVQAAGIGGGSIPALVQGLSAASQSLGDSVGHGIAGKNVAGNLISNIVSYPIQGVTAGYQLGDAALHPTSKGLAFAKGIGQQFAHPVKSFEQNPLYTALLFRGAAAGVGRGVGAAARAAGGGKAGATGLRAALGNTGRASLNVDGVPMARTGSRDAFVRLGQRAVDVRRTRKYGPGPKATSYGQTRATVNTGPRSKYTPDWVINRRAYSIADAIAGKVQAGENATRTRVATDLHGTAPIRGSRAAGAQRILKEAPLHGRLAKILPKAIRNIAYRPERDAVALLAKGVVRTPKTFWSDLERVRARALSGLKEDDRTHNHYSNPALRQQAEDLVSTIDRVKAAKNKINVDHIFNARDQLAPIANELERQSGPGGAGILPDGAARAKYFEYAQEHIGARYGKPDAAEIGTKRRAAQVTLQRAETQAREKVATLERHLYAVQRGRRITAQHGDVRTAMAKTHPDREGGNAEDFKAVRAAAESRLSDAQIHEKIAVAKKEGAARVATAKARLASIEKAKNGALLTKDGEYLPNEAIAAHMRANGVDPEKIFYLPNSMKSRGGGAFHKKFALNRRNIIAEPKTGAAYEKGAIPHTWEHIVESLVGRATTLQNIASHDKLLKDIGQKKADGQYFNSDEISHILENNGYGPDGHFYGHNVTGVRAFNSRYHDSASVDAAQDGMAHFDPEQSLMAQHFADRMDLGKGDAKARNMVLIHDAIGKRLLEHVQGGAHRPTMNLIDSAFRRAVLPFSTKWLFGNTFEAALRSAAAGANPLTDHRGALAVFRQMLREDATATHGARGAAAADEAAAARTLGAKVPLTAARARRNAADRKLEGLAPNATAFRQDIRGGLLYGNRALTRHVGKGESLAGHGGSVVADAPVVHELGQTIKTLTDGIFKGNRKIEQYFETLAFGKHARREMQSFGVSWHNAVRFQKEAVEQAAKGMLHTSQQVKAAHWMHETLGKYSGFSPKMRRAIQQYAPFLPWYLNSARFVFHTLPVRYPVTTAILTQAERAFQQDWEEQHKDVPPGSLKTAIPFHGGWLDLARYTPFGFPGPVAAGDLGELATPLLPQFSSLEKGLQGQDPFGRTLVGADGKPLKGGAKALYVANQALEGFVPGVSLGRRLQEGGRTPRSTSTIFSPQTKPGTGHGSALDRVLNPLHPTYLKAGSGSGPVVSVAPGSAQAILAGARGHAVARPGLSDAQAILARTRGH